MFLFDILKQTISGKSLTRGLLNLAIRDLCLEPSGKVVDLGSGAKRPSYFRFVKVNSGTKITSIDINPQVKPDIVADLSRKIPLEANSVDFLFLMNTMHLISDPKNILKESRRVLKKGGNLLVNFALIWPIGNEPKDYWRYTDNAVRLLFKEAGLQIDKLVFYGDRISSAVSLVDNHLPIFVRAILHPLALVGDKVFNRLVTNPYPCPIGTLVLAEKIVV